jgi:hypothetical protein
MKIKLFVPLIVGFLLFGCSQNAAPTAVPVVATQPPSVTPNPTATNVPPTSTLQPTVTSIPTATEIVPGAVLFEEDFEDGKADNFVYIFNSFFVTTEDNGNKVFEINTNTETAIKKGDGGGIGFGSNYWRNYSAEYRVKMLNSQANTFLKFRCDMGDNPFHYIEWLSAEHDSIYLHSSLNFDGWVGLKGLDLPVWDERWYQVKVEAQGSSLRVYLDNALVLQTDDSSLTNGGFELGVFPGTHALFDDIRITALDETP